MATRNATLKVAIEGEQQYKNALKELNQGSAVLASEMKKLSAEFAGNEKSIEALNAKGDLLQRQLLQQKDKVETLKKALAESAKNFGEADKRTQEWQIKLNSAEAAQAKIEQQIKQTNEEIANQGKITLTVGDAVDQLASKLGINLPKSATDALNSTVKFSSGTIAAMGAAAAGVAALMKVIKELHDMTLQAAADVDELVTESMVTGLSTDTIQQLKYAENIIDVSYSTISGTLTKLTKTMADARDGNKNLAESFASLGVSITDSTGQLRPAEEVFYDVIDALGQVQNGTERDALAMDLLGKSAQDLNPLILQGSDAMRELAAEAEATGYVLDESQIAKLAEVDDAYQRMQLEIEATKKKLAVEFAPASKQAMEAFQRVVTTAANKLTESKIVENLASLVASTMSLIETCADLFDAMPSWMNPLNQLSDAFRGLAVIMATISDTMNVITGLFTLDFDRVKTGLGWNMGSGQLSNLQQLKYRDSDYVWYNAAGDQNWRGGLTWVGESGPELVNLPRGSQIYSNQESQQIAGGDTYYNITVANVNELNEIVDWFESRRIRGRMA